MLTQILPDIVFVLPTKVMNPLAVLNENYEL